MGCGISNFGIENLAVPGCFTNNLHQDNVQPTNYEDADDARKQTLKKIETRCVDSDDSMEKKEEPENEKEELEGLRKEKIEEHRQSTDQDEETELCDEREDSLMASVSPSFRVYCLDSDSENSSKKFGEFSSIFPLLSFSRIGKDVPFFFFPQMILKKGHEKLSYIYCL